MRFEKGIDIASCDEAAKRAAQLMVKYCGGTAAQGKIDVCSAIPQPVQIILRAERVNHLLGTSFTLDEIQGVITALGFALEAAGDDALLVTVPTYRQDISLEVDLIEEVSMRLSADVLQSKSCCVPLAIPVQPVASTRRSIIVSFIPEKLICCACRQSILGGALWRSAILFLRINQ